MTRARHNRYSRHGLRAPWNPVVRDGDANLAQEKVFQQKTLQRRVVVLLLFGALIVLTQGSAVAPFIYTLF